MRWIDDPHAFLGPHHAWYHDDSTFLASSVDLLAELDGQTATVTLVNQTGHAFPSGFPGRMAVVMVKGLDAQGTAVWKKARMGLAPRVQATSSMDRPMPSNAVCSG